MLAADAFDAWGWWDASSSGDDYSWDWTWTGSDDQWSGDVGWDWGDASWSDSEWLDDGTLTGDPGQADSGEPEVVEPDVSPIADVTVAPDAPVPEGAGEAPAEDSAADDAVMAVVVIPPEENAPGGSGTDAEIVDPPAPTDDTAWEVDADIGSDDAPAEDSAGDDTVVAMVVDPPEENAPGGGWMDPEIVDPPAPTDDVDWEVDAVIGSDDFPDEDDQPIDDADLDAVVSGDVADPFEGDGTSGETATGLPQPGPSVAGPGTDPGRSSASIAMADYDRFYAILSAAFSQFGSETQDVQPAGWMRKSPRR